VPESRSQTETDRTKTEKRTHARKRPEKNQYEVFGKIYTIMPSNLGYLEIGIASWYGRKFHGRLTAMGETYDMYGMTAAHKALPLPTVVKVTNLDNGRSIVVRVNDRGPFHDDRLIDLSYAAARALGFDDKGTAPVVVEALDDVNHPELMAVAHRDSYYLQVGAFSSRRGAQSNLDQVKQALPEGVNARILTSETANGILYKVWIGPLESIEEEQIVAARIRDRNLGNPLRVKVD
jgi:rare lipoprotein A